MCGIFAIAAKPEAGLDGRGFRDLVDRLFLLSETRGQEAVGLAVRTPETIEIYKQAGRPSRMLKGPNYAAFWKGLTDSDAPGTQVVVGHARLVTNGFQTLDANNQPVFAEGVVGVHNGIIVNDGDLRARHPDLPHRSDVDTELLMGLVGRHRAAAQGDPKSGVAGAFAEIEGAATVALLFDDADRLALATNTGTLYTARPAAGALLVAASERYILEEFLKSDPLKEKAAEVVQVPAGTGLDVDLASLDGTAFNLVGDGANRPVAAAPGSRRDIVERVRTPDDLRRCTRCLLPSTFPMITFDADGVCSKCADYQKRALLGREALEAAVAPHRRSNGRPDCIVAFSGGRDSSYGLHYVKEELGLNPVAFTYDWGMVTDIARRNQARLTGALGVEHAVRAADIPTKRRYIRKNLEAWLKAPKLGMIPLFMAGDKQFYYYARQLRKETGIDLVIFCAGNALEHTDFKTGFAGVRKEGGEKAILTDLPLSNKLQLAAYYGANYLANPRYLNASLFDSVWAFYESYLVPDDFLYLYRYIDWDERQIQQTLAQYNWEGASDSATTWRIGDGTAAFYNYIYHTVAGFTENDTLRSNQIREGLIDRETALAMVQEENRPRFDAMQEYCQMVGVNFEEVLITINAIPRLY